MYRQIFPLLVLVLLVSGCGEAVVSSPDFNAGSQSPASISVPDDGWTLVAEGYVSHLGATLQGSRYTLVMPPASVASFRTVSVFEKDGEALRFRVELTENQSAFQGGNPIQVTVDCAGIPQFGTSDPQLYEAVEDGWRVVPSTQMPQANAMSALIYAGGEYIVNSAPGTTEDARGGGDVTEAK